jgi:hypothetical protein
MYREPYRLRLASILSNQLTTGDDDMSTKKLLKMLNELGKEADNHISSLNRGGCAVFAAHVGYYLKYRAGIKDVKLRVGHSWAGNSDAIPAVDEVRNNVHPNANAAEWSAAGLNFGHVIVEFTTGKMRKTARHYDSDGVTKQANVTNNFGFSLHPGSMTVEEGLQIASEQDGWNRQFDREQIPTLINIIDKHFHAYVNR